MVHQFHIDLNAHKQLVVVNIPYRVFTPLVLNSILTLKGHNVSILYNIQLCYYYPNLFRDAARENLVLISHNIQVTGIITYDSSIYYIHYTVLYKFHDILLFLIQMRTLTED